MTITFGILFVKSMVHRVETYCKFKAAVCFGRRVFCLEIDMCVSYGNACLGKTTLFRNVLYGNAGLDKDTLLRNR